MRRNSGVRTASTEDEEPRLGPIELKRFLREGASRYGFSALGVCRISPIAPGHLDDWLGRGFQGKMSYLERNREKRLDPRRILPGAKTVVSVALNYLGPVAPPSEQRGLGVVSRYAVGTDYHIVLEKKLGRLLDDLHKVAPDIDGKIYVDTGPVLEKHWAVMAGLGWMGKHTNVISRRLGSWFFLGEMILNVELEPDAVEADFCGTCTRCIDACPTNAIVEPYVLDASKCLSYSTIELKGDVPEELREPAGNLIFGCDICQEVCPWNRKAPLGTEREFEPKDRDYGLRSLARLTQEEFSVKFRDSPVKRAKWRGLMRNVAVAAGNSGLRELVPEIARLLETEDAMVRRHAAWALKRIGGQLSRRILLRRVEHEQDPATLEVLRSALEKS